MKNSVLTAALAFAFLSHAAFTESASGQNAILAEMYGRGVHAYFAGQMEDANTYLTMAIDNGIQDPRAYYFRGMVSDLDGHADKADADWKVGAEMEASGRTNPAVGRSLSRFQGSARLRLERIRQSARLQAMATAMTRSKERYGEIKQSQPTVVRSKPTPVAPPPVPSNVENPFADDMAAGQPKVVAQDALKDAMNDPFADDGGAAPGGAPAAGGGADPFGGNAGGGGADPFGGGGGGADPFGGGGGGGGADPFGGGGGGDAGADPFGGNPFGN